MYHKLPGTDLEWRSDRLFIIDFKDDIKLYYRELQEADVCIKILPYGHGFVLKNRINSGYFLSRSQTKEILDKQKEI